MGEGLRRRAVRVRQRWVLGILIALTAVLVTWGGVVAWPYAKARGYRHRIEKGQNPEGYLRCVAALRHPAAVPVLEDYALKRPWANEVARRTTEPTQAEEHLAQRLADVAGRLLAKHYPDSTIPRGMRDYEKVVSHPYFGGFTVWRLLSSKPSPADTVQRFRDWLARYPDHPARDDALLRIAREIESAEPIEALRLLYAAHRAPDGDKSRVVRNWFQRVLERYASADDLERWVAQDCPPDVKDNVLYVVAVKRMREHKFWEAARCFERSFEARATADAILRGTFRHGRYRGPLSILDQFEACLWFESKHDQLGRTIDREARAALLHEMGRRCFDEERMFWNYYYYEVVLPGDRETRASSKERDRPRIDVNDVGLANHYRQATEFFQEIVRSYPDYSAIEDVEYSLPLCLVRLRRAWHITLGAALDPAIHEGFQRFAEKYPQSTMADDALYWAGVHHFLSSRSKDTSVLTANMKRIADDYPDGDVVEGYAESSHWLASALEARKVELARSDR